MIAENSKGLAKEAGFYFGIDHPESTKAKVEREVGTPEEGKKLHSP